jgi:methyl-accepting chemotaxis protein
MERKEPTLSAGANNSNGANSSNGGSNDRDEAPIRRSAPVYDEPRTSRSAAAEYRAPSSASPVPAIALVIALVGVLGAAFLGFQLMELQAKSVKDAARIAQLESQLDVTSTNSTQSVGALQINLQKVDGDVKKLQDVVRKLTADHNQTLASHTKSLENAKAEIGNLKGGINLLQQDSLAHKASFEEVAASFGNVEKNIAAQSKKISDVSASVNVLVNQVKSAEALASRITKTEEAIDSIDDNRRNINKDILLIKQQLGIKN